MPRAGSRLAALFVARDLLERGRRDGSKAYVNDRGPKAPPRLRYEAGVLTSVGKHSGIGFRTDCVYAASWSELPDAIRAFALRERVRGWAPTDWLLALAICCAEGRLDAGNARQFCEWLVDLDS